ncbi:MAG: DUF4091 domain-containing protein [Phycisphaerales bacterium]|nr:MAG: DUF4091 domain-containing protein [Phycisphaerales bacterium]
MGENAACLRGCAAGSCRSAALALLVAVTVAGCSGPAKLSSVSVWVADDAQPPAEFPITGTESDLFNPETRELSLAGGINETLGIHLALFAGDGALPALDVIATDLQSGDDRVSASVLRFYRLHSVHVDRWPGWHIRLIEPQRRTPDIPDVVVPADAPSGGLPADLQTGEVLRLWIDVHIPKGTAPGSYDGQLVIRSRGEAVDTIAVTLTVWPFLLPDVTHPALLTELDHRSLFAHHLQYQDRPYAPERFYADDPLRGELEALLASTMRLLQSHKLSPVLPHLRPIVKITGSHAVTVDWSDYDRVVLAYLNGSRFADRRPLPVWPIPFDETFPPAPSYAAVDSPSYAATVRRYLRQCAVHFDELESLDRTYVTIPFANHPDADAFVAVRHFGHVIRNAHPRLRRLCRLFPQDMTAYGWQQFPFVDVSSHVEIWCPPAQFLDPSAGPTWPAPRSEAWFRVDRPPFSGSIEITAPPVYTRVIPWQGRRLGSNIVVLGLANDRSRDDKDLASQQCIDRSPSLLVYPGAPFGLRAPVASLRLKRLRRGMQDLALLDLAQTHELSHVAEAIAESLAPFAAADAYAAHFADGRRGAWVEDPRLWRLACRVLTDELVRKIEGASAGHWDDLTGTLRWRQFMTETRNVNVKVDGVRVRAAGRRPQDGAVIEAQLTITNHTRVPQDGTIGFGALPIGWSPEPPRIDLPRIAPGRAARVTLTARAATLTWGSQGVRYLPIRLEVNRRTIDLAARLAYVHASQITDAITIDGDLSDWPPSPGNVAADFILVTGETPDATQLPSARPGAATECRVARDSRHLYFGFRCPGSGGPDLQARSNIVTYQDMIPVGEDLVEVLIDPDATGTRSTGDLYHLVLKPSGAAWEHGIGTDPPTGPRRVWAADIRHAARRHGQHWETEVRIPLTAFDRPIRDHEIWSVNFTCFDAGRQEYANWSGAVSNVYDPLSLGNLGL